MTEINMLPLYHCHKQVRALKIAAIDTAKLLAGALLTFEEEDESGDTLELALSTTELGKFNPKVGGYWVFYEDGYQSFSPAKAFEDGYDVPGMALQRKLQDPVIQEIIGNLHKDVARLNMPGDFDVLHWARTNFGPIALNRDERAARLVEEAIEVAQVEGVTQATMLQILQRVYERDVGELQQEIGGLMIGLLALCANARVDWRAALRAEFDRVLSKPKEHWEKKHAEKVEAGTANLSPVPQESPESERYIPAPPTIPAGDEFAWKKGDMVFLEGGSSWEVKEALPSGHYLISNAVEEREVAASQLYTDDIPF